MTKQLRRDELLRLLLQRSSSRLELAAQLNCRTCQVSQLAGELRDLGYDIKLNQGIYSLIQ